MKLNRRSFLTLTATGIPGVVASVKAVNALAADGKSVRFDDYELGPDSKPQPGVPQGKTFEFIFDSSRIFPGTVRTISVYVPAQYTGENPACVYVGLDRLAYNVPTVFDNLIHKDDMPVTIAIGVSPGHVDSVRAAENPRFNRSFEFDGLNDSLARCIVEEIFPAVERRVTPDGLPIKLSANPNDRCSGGGSTGGIGAFTLAWERPDLFRRVFTSVGTFVGMRGGDRYPVLVRKTEPKPIRIFMQDGSNDQWMGGPEVGDWWMSNQTLQRALEFAGYDHQFVWGTGSHNSKHATAIFPDAMRYLWSDWPKPILAQVSGTQNVVLKTVLDPNTGWKRISDAGQACDRLAVAPAGGVFFFDQAVQRWSEVDAAGRVRDAEDLTGNRAIAFNAEGHAVYATDIEATCLVVANDGRQYVTDAGTGRLWLVRSSGEKVLLDDDLESPTGVALTPDGLWLAVMERRAPWGYSYRVQSDGTVDLKQRFYWLHTPDGANGSGAGGVCMDRDGLLYVATNMGVQILDRNGRSRGILPLPTGQPTGVAFGGPTFDTLYATSSEGLYWRTMKAVGAPPFAAAMKLPRWKAG